ncbi:MAG: LacI family DNA-binding transcriptional regulator [Kiritimatiellia bacterium]
MNDKTDIPRMVDVARAAGVHQTTVSRALRGDPALPEATRTRLTALAEEMGYRRNPLVSALVAERRRGHPSGHGDVLAVLTPGGGEASLWRKKSDTYRRLYQLLSHHANRMGYRLEEFSLEGQGGRPGRLEEILVARGVRGVMLAPMPMETDRIAFEFRSFAAVAMRIRLHSPELDRVVPNYFSAMETALEKLEATGHTRIGFLSDLDVDERVRHRSLGAYEANHFQHPDLLAPPLIVPRWRKTVFLRWVRTHRPDAIVTSVYDHHALTTCWLREAGRKIPEDLSVISLDCHADTAEAGIQHNLDLEAEHLIKLLSRKVEIAEFGVPAYACQVDIPGVWRDGPDFAPRKTGGTPQSRENR